MNMQVDDRNPIRAPLASDIKNGVALPMAQARSRKLGSAWMHKPVRVTLTWAGRRPEIESQTRSQTADLEVPEPARSA